MQQKISLIVIEIKILQGFKRACNRNNKLYKKKEMAPLIHEENKSYKKQKVSYICQKGFSTDDGTTRKYRGAAHNICNLRYKTPKEILAVFHNGSTYDYHFIIKKLAKEFEGQCECLGENTEKYITFSVSIKKGLDNNKTVIHTLKFVNSFRFISTLLSKLANNLSEIYSKNCPDKKWKPECEFKVLKNQSVSQGSKQETHASGLLICITHDIYQSLDDGLETRAVFLEISKAFGKVWHEGFLFNLRQNGTSGNLLNVITDFLYQRKKRVVLNGQQSPWNNVQAGIPQRSILGPFFLSDLYQWLIWWLDFKCKIIYGWHLSVFHLFKI